jgi:hypothetical protein
LSEVTTSKILHATTKLAVKLEDNQLSMCFITIKTMVSCENGFEFVSVIKKIKDKSMTALIDLNGVLS